MELGNYNVFGCNILTEANPHWLQMYGEVIGTIYSMSKDDKIELSCLTINHNSEIVATSEEICDNIFRRYGLYVEGYTLRVVSVWVIQYCKDWFAQKK